MFCTCSISLVLPRPGPFKLIEAHPDTGVTTRCSLWSMVKHVGANNQSLINPPYVHWEKASKTNQTEFHPLRDVWYWYITEGLYFLPSLKYYCDKSQREKDVYDCGIVIERCSKQYFGTYKFIVTEFDYGSEMEQILKLRPPANPVSRCYMPQAENITAKLITGDNGIHMINVSWEYAPKPRDLSFCHTSRQWQIRGFNGTTPHPFQDGKEPSIFRAVEFLNTSKKRDTFYVFQLNEAQRNNYFQFQVQNRKRNVDSTGFVIEKYTSRVFTFKKQSKPVIVSMHRHEV